MKVALAAYHRKNARLCPEKGWPTVDSQAAVASRTAVPFQNLKKIEGL
jgi:hypothetical protein